MMRFAPTFHDRPTSQGEGKLTLQAVNTPPQRKVVQVPQVVRPLLRVLRVLLMLLVRRVPLGLPVLPVVLELLVPHAVPQSIILRKGIVNAARPQPPWCGG